MKLKDLRKIELDPSQMYTFLKKLKELEGKIEIVCEMEATEHNIFSLDDDLRKLAIEKLTDTYKSFCPSAEFYGIRDIVITGDIGGGLNLIRRLSKSGKDRDFRVSSQHYREIDFNYDQKKRTYTISGVYGGDDCDCDEKCPKDCNYTNSQCLSNLGSIVIAYVDALQSKKQQEKKND